ncbi:HAD family hydrolase [Mycolicibacter hiberniae]|uniref:HAD family hydrolase n=1 Tax=Mycolicibacter hiberniae TaxID=29314 RepID=UPI000A15FBAB|nr:HAD family hydrolase [Mycolicibacter hiberniae]MCV7085964.1 HAD family hydrolase [Mycolicibacter hiberniae]ORV72008.1 HAD family hydrolase [Mycolicibacter hiberniae]
MGIQPGTSATGRTTHVGGQPAVLFDIDGTLVDSNYLHVYAWQRSFAELHIEVECWRIHRAIGMDGAELVRTLSGDADEDVRQRLHGLHSRYYLESAELLAPLPGARALLESVAALGLPVVLATSAPEDELAVLRKVLACDELIAAVTSSADVDVAKPHPGIIGVALDRVGATAESAVFVGDAVWDAKACARAGVVSIGLLSGGVCRSELDNAGAAAVFDNAEDLSAHLDQTPICEFASGRGPQ